MSVRIMLTVIILSRSPPEKKSNPNAEWIRAKDENDDCSIATVQIYDKKNVSYSWKRYLVNVIGRLMYIFDENVVQM